MQFFVFFILFITYECFSKSLTLHQAIKLGFKQSFEIKQATIENEISKDELKVQRILFFTPQVSLSAEMTYEQTLFQSKYGSGFGGVVDPDPFNKIKNQRSSQVALSVSGINLFNSWMDKEALDSAKAGRFLQQISFENTIRDYVMSIISSYFKTYISQKSKENAKRVINVTKALLEVAEATESAESSNYLTLKGEFIDARRALEEARVIHSQNLSELNIAVNNTGNPDYNLQSEIKVKNQKISVARLKKKMKTFPEYYSAKESLRSAKIALRRMKLSYLPSLSVDLTGVTIGKAKDSFGNTSIIRQFGGDGNTNISASLGVSIPLWGDGGIANSISYRRAVLDLVSTENAHSQILSNIPTQIENIVSQLSSQEMILKDTNESLSNSESLLNLVVEKFGQRSASVLEVKQALETFIESYEAYLNSQLEYLETKYELVGLTGDIGYLGLEGIEQYVK